MRRGRHRSRRGMLHTRHIRRDQAGRDTCGPEQDAGEGSDEGRESRKRGVRRYPIKSRSSVAVKTGRNTIHISQGGLPSVCCRKKAVGLRKKAVAGGGWGGGWAKLTGCRGSSTGRGRAFAHSPAVQMGCELPSR